MDQQEQNKRDQGLTIEHTAEVYDGGPTMAKSE